MTSYLEFYDDFQPQDIFMILELQLLYDIRFTSEVLHQYNIINGFKYKLEQTLLT